MYECMELFSAPTRAWFAHAFEHGPTQAQREAWPVIASGQSTLVIAPTGSGKTLAAFLYAIDRLLHVGAAQGGTECPESLAEDRAVPAGGVDGPQCESTQDVRASGRRTAGAADGRRTSGGRSGVKVLYISPLKALGVDVARNLNTPLEGITAQCVAQGLKAPSIRVATRSGDTAPKERRAIASHPPDILVTTPESLYLLLTSKARRILRSVGTVIVDEIHAVAGTKRGAHLALSLERLDLLTKTPAQRIGLSATVRPPEEAARFLGGARAVTVVDASAAPAMDLRIVEPAATMPDPNEDKTKARVGGVPTGGVGGRPISGVTPAMRRLAERQGRIPSSADHSGTGVRADDGVGNASGDDAATMPVPQKRHVPGGGATSDQTSARRVESSASADDADSGNRSRHASLPAGDQAESAYRIPDTALDDDRNGSIWPAIERDVLRQILTHRTTLVFVNSRGLAERLTARLNDLYAAMPGHATGNPGGALDSASSAEERDRTGMPQAAGASDGNASPRSVGLGGGRHYDATLGPSTNLVPPQDPDHAIAMAHHGSVSKDRRKRIEEDLKHGRLRCVVATSSLELGIDMGSVDLVIQIAPPLSVSSGLQRVGRADHRVGGVSHALFYPLTREQIIGSAAAVEAMRAGAIEPLAVPRCPLDILAQQTVAAAAMEDLKPDDWYAVVRRAAPFADLDRSVFDSVLGMLAGDYNSEEFSAFRPVLVWNRDDDVVSARPGAQRLAVTSGGTIPDRGLYTVVLPESDAGSGPRRVGELDEEMVYESRVGDVITLGTSTWQIQEITRDRVMVTPAPGRTARLPFWHGEGNGRDAGFGALQGRFIRELSAELIDDGPGGAGRDGADDVGGRDGDDGRVDGVGHDASDGVPNGGSASDVASDGGPTGPQFTPTALARLRDDGLDDNAVDNLARLLHEQCAATGTVPNDRNLVVERCPDEEGDWRVVLHSPYGRRVHEPWAMIVSNRIKRRYGYDGQVYAADDGIIVRLPQGDGRIPAADLFLFDPDDVRREVAEQVGESVLFASRFRECAARSLYLPRATPGRRVPLWQQRLRAAQLLNAARTQRNFPLILETTRECLQDVYDMTALRRVMAGLQDGTIGLVDVETRDPSPFAENLLFGYVGQVMYQYDQPQAERSASLLSLDFDALERLLGTTDMSTVLDPDVIREVERELGDRTFWNELDAHDVAGRVARYAKTHGPFTADAMIADLGIDAAGAVHELDRLKTRGEVLAGTFVGEASDGVVQYLHRDVFRRIRSRSLRKARQAVKPVQPVVYQSFLLDRQGVGPVGGQRYEGADGLMRVIEQLEGVALPAAAWESTVFPARIRDYSPALLDELLASGDVIWVGSKRNGSKAEEPGDIAFHPADSPLLHNPMMRPAPSSSRMPDSDDGDMPSSSDVAGMASTGRSTPSTSAKSATSPSMPAEMPTLPDAILRALAGGGAFRGERLAELTRAAWHADDGIMVDPHTGEILDDRPNDGVGLPIDPQTGEILDDAVDLADGADGNLRIGRVIPTWSDEQFRQALWSLVWQGAVTNGSFAPVRAMLGGAGTTKRVTVTRRRIRARITVPPQPATMSGLWSAVPDNASSAEQTAIALVETLLDRYGLIAAPLVDKEAIPGGFSGLYPVLKRMEDNGTLLRGMFVEGFGAAQFAERGVVDLLRRSGDGHSRSCVAIDVTDPANLVGGAIAWPQPSAKRSAKPARRHGNIIVLDQGEPVLYAAVRGHHLTTFDGGDASPHGNLTEERRQRLQRACTELGFMLQHRGGAGGVTFADIDGEPLTARTEASRTLHAAGFTPCPQGVKIYG